MTWKHVVLVVVGALVATIGAIYHADQAITVAMGIITGALGHAGSGRPQPERTIGGPIV